MCERERTHFLSRLTPTPPPRFILFQVPAALTAAVAFNADALQAVIARHAYVVYPPEGPRPPPPDEVRALAKKNVTK